MTTRRQFLKTVGGVTLLTIVFVMCWGEVLIAPSDELTKGIIGVGGMGQPSRRHTSSGHVRC